MRSIMFLTLAMLPVLLLGATQLGEFEQDYGQDYSQDNLYHDYAMKQQEKEVGKV